MKYAGLMLALLIGQAHAQGAYMATEPGSKVIMPTCSGTWAEVSPGQSAGSRAVFQAAAITETATLEVSGPGGVVATLKYPETKVWECFK
jgi:hypothetical protein